MILAITDQPRGKSALAGPACERLSVSMKERPRDPNAAPNAPLRPQARFMTLADTRSDFEILDDWEDRYRYVIELGRALPPLPDALRTDANKVRGCASQVWLATRRVPSSGGGKDRLDMQGASDALIVQGLIAVLFSIYEGKTVDEIIAIDAQKIFAELGLKEHLTQQRSNGLASMVQRIRADAAAIAAA
jgi:cysteine desulfuration protein SufE